VATPLYNIGIDIFSFFVVIMLGKDKGKGFGQETSQNNQKKECV
jgi:hypothetical protein